MGIPVENFIHTGSTMLGYLPKAIADATCRASFPSPSSPKGQPECPQDRTFYPRGNRAPQGRERSAETLTHNA
jgi:hypothetical protein